MPESEFVTNYAINDYKETDGLAFRMLNIEINSTLWKGHLLMIYEVKTNTLFHHFIVLNKKQRIKSGLILYEIAKAINHINENMKEPLLERENTIFIPTISEIDTDIQMAYDETAREINSNNKKDEVIGAEWNRQLIEPINFYKFKVERLSSQPNIIIQIDVKESLDFKNTLNRISKRLTKNTLKKRREEELEAKSKGNNDKLRKLKETPIASWYGINPVRARTKLDPKRFDKKNNYRKEDRQN